MSPVYGLGPLALLILLALYASRVRANAWQRPGRAPPAATYVASARIAAPASRVWTILADVLRWADWTPTVTRAEALDGTALAPGARFRVHQPGLRPNVWTVTDVVVGQRFAWTSDSPGLRLVADHALTELDPGTTQLDLRFEMGGALAGLLARLVGAQAQQFVATEARSLKARAEAT